MDIPPTPIWQVLLLESPAPLLAVLGLAAAAGGWRALRPGGGNEGRRARIAALSAVVLLAGIAVLARVVRTDREAIRDATRALVGATAPHDPVRLARHLTEQVVLSDPDGGVILRGPELTRAMNRLLARYPIAHQRIAGLEAGVQRRGGLAIARSEVALVSRLATTAPGGDGPNPSRWGLVWEQRADGSWAVNELRCLSWRLRDPGPILDLLAGTGWR